MTPANSAPDGDDLRAVMTEFATGVAVATTRHGGVDHAITVNSLTSVSLDPPMVLLCLGTTSRFALEVQAAGVWGISILRAEDGEIARRLAVRGPRPGPVLEGIPHHTGATGVPLLDGSLARLECATRQIHEAGDHLIVVGEVVSTSTGPASRANGDASAIIDSVGPLVNWRGAFGTFG